MLCSSMGHVHFKQYLYQNYFTLQTNHKPLEWLAMVSNTYGKKGRWIYTLQDFNFKIIHITGSKHTNLLKVMLSILTIFLQLLCD